MQYLSKSAVFPTPYGTAEVKGDTVRTRSALNGHTRKLLNVLFVHAAIVLAGVALYLSGFAPGPDLPTPPVGQARAGAGGEYAAPAGLSPELLAALRSVTDSVVMTLDGVLAALPDTRLDERGGRELLAGVLDSLSLRGSRLYFTAWKGTRNLYAPLSPDAEGMDFAEVLDANGMAFVREVERAAQRGGGFLRVRLPPPFLGGDAAVSGNGAPEDQILYVRALSGAENVAIAAFMPEHLGAGRNGAGFASLPQALFSVPRDAAGRVALRRGLRLVALALAGAAALTLLPTRLRHAA
jgi:hypothetical protein